MRNILSALVIIIMICFCMACSSPQGKKSQVSFVKGEKKIDVLIKGNFFTSYQFDETTLTKPVLFPVKSVDGTNVTRMYPFEEIKGESNDHPHHTGIFFTYDKVNDNGFWNNTTFPPQIRHIETMVMDPENGTLCTHLQWSNRNETPILDEHRCMVFSREGHANCIDMTMKLTALDEKVVFKDTKEGMFAIRVAHWLKEQGNDSEYLSSNGEKNEKNVWGKRAKWMRLEGKKDKTYGIIIMNHPESENYPTYWHARGYGLFAANPLGQSVFEKAWDGDTTPYNLTLQPGESALFRFKIVVYEKAMSAQDIDEMYNQYIQN